MTALPGAPETVVAPYAVESARLPATRIAKANTGGPSEPPPVLLRDDWPRTTRVLPWMLAAFIAMLWLVPFDQISMTVSLPFELKLDRIVLPVIVGVWCLALAVGGRNAPRVRLTAVHVAVGTYVAIAFLSVILNAGWLNTTLLLSSSLKQLVLLSSYVMLFVMIASVVRPSEVAAFLKYTLILAVMCGVGALWEYHFHYAVFYQWAHSVLPSSLFQLPMPDTTAVDDLGRRSLFGPTSGPIELAVIMSLALPLALVGVMRAKRRRDYILYILASCVLLAATFATFRKTSLVLPVGALLLLTYLRPRHMARLVPLLPVLLVVVHLLAPQAIGSVIAEIQPSQAATVGTTEHRDDGYEAARPLVWSRPALGQGYGSYNGNVNRIFDSQILDSLVETGVVGLLAYLAMMVTVFAVARSLFRRWGGESEFGRAAVPLAVGAIVFLLASFLYDAMSFPHGPYIFLTYAAFVAVLAGAAKNNGNPLRRPSGGL